MADDYDSQTASILEALDKVATRVVRRLTFSVHAELVEANPVDTGWSRANWIATTGAPFEGVVGSPDQVDIGAGSASVAHVGSSYQAGSGLAVFLANNVPYMPKLAAGHSPQAPAGWIEDAIERGVAAIGRGRL